jgi:uncharacterized protein (DUF2147 family)
MNTNILKTLASLALALSAGSALAQATPAGLWRTIDDDGKTEKSLVRISDSAGTFSGKVEKIANPARQDARCDDCSDARKGQPVLGMTILQGVKASGNEAGLWDGGEILDPNNGKTYKVRMRLANDGKALELRAYIGLPMLGRTQTWQRVE